MHIASLENRARDALTVRGSTGDVLAVLFADTDPRDSFAAPVAELLAGQVRCRVAIVAPEIAAVDPSAMAKMLDKAVADCKRRFVLAFGSQVHAAAELANELAADAFVAVAPGWNREKLEPSAPSAVLPPMAILSGTDTPPAWCDCALPVDRHPIPLASAALPAALRQSGKLELILAALTSGSAFPPLEDLTNAWHKRCAYELNLIEPAKTLPEGEFLFVGELVNKGEIALHFGLAQADRLFIGARVKRNDESVWHCEARALPARTVLAPGEGSRFAVRVAGPRDASTRDLSMELSLVAEGFFWYSDLGFPTIRLGGEPTRATVPAQPSRAPNQFHDHDQRLAERATLDDLWNCYRLILGRAPDPDGYAYHAQLVDAGISLDALVLSFLSAPEAVARFDALRNRHHEKPDG